MGDQWVHIKVRESTKNKVKQIERVFLEEYPEFKDMNLTYDFLLNKAFDFYIEE